MTKKNTGVLLSTIFFCSCFCTVAGCGKHTENEPNALSTSQSITEMISNDDNTTHSETSKIITEETTINVDDKRLNCDENTSYVRCSDGTFNNSTEYALNSIQPQYNLISVGDKLGNITVEKIISNFDNETHLPMQSQICFSGEVTLSGYLYYGNNEALSFGSVKLDENVLYFIPKLTDESEFPLSLQANEYFTVYDDVNCFYLTADSEPIMLGMGKEVDELVEDITFSPSRYTFATVTFKNLQLRYGLDWFALEYENCAVPIKIIS